MFVNINNFYLKESPCNLHWNAFAVCKNC